MWVRQPRDPELEELIKHLSVGRLVQAARGRSDQTQFEFAWDASIPQSALSAYETGARLPTIRTLVRIAAQAGASLRITLASESIEFNGDHYRERKQALRSANSLEIRIARDRERYGRPLALQSSSEDEHSIPAAPEQPHHRYSERGDQYDVSD